MTIRTPKKTIHSIAAAAVLSLVSMGGLVGTAYADSSINTTPDGTTISTSSSKNGTAIATAGNRGLAKTSASGNNIIARAASNTAATAKAKSNGGSANASATGSGIVIASASSTGSGFASASASITSPGTAHAAATTSKTKPPKRVTITKTFLVAKYAPKTKQQARLVAALDNDNVLKFEEDLSLRSLKGHKIEFVTVKVPAKADRAQIKTALNKKTTVGDVNTFSKIDRAYAGKTYVIAWELGKGATAEKPWGKNNNINPTFFARS